MTKEKKDNKISESDEEFSKLLEENVVKVPQVSDTVKGTVLAASRAEVRLDIDGILTGIVRGPELYEEVDDYANLKPGDKVEATVIDEENENGELELSFKYAGEEKAWNILRSAFANKETIKVKVISANKGGLLANFGQIGGFLPVSQLSPENYPRVSGGDRSKILEKLKSFEGNELDVKLVNLDERGKEERIIFSEKDVWSEQRKDIISKYKVGTKVAGKVAAITDFGLFITFGDNLEGLIHISELAWQRIDNPSDLYSVGDSIKAEVIGIDGSKIFLSAKKLLKDPWADVEKKYKKGQSVKGTVLKVNPFGLFVKLDKDIHGLAHISQLALAPGQKINEIFKGGDKMEFIVMSVEAKNHRLGLGISKQETKEDKRKGKEGGNEKKNKKEGKSKAVKKEVVKKEEDGEVGKQKNKGNQQDSKKKDEKKK